jgi:polyhydroxybutyrate depolymerase
VPGNAAEVFRKHYRLKSDRTMPIVLFLAIALAAGAVWWQIWSTWRVYEVDVIPAVEIKVGGVPRTYRLVAPHEPPQGLMPVIFAFHGIGDSPESMVASAELNRLVSGHGFLLVCPRAHDHAWTTIGPDAANPESNEDIQFFDAILNELGQRDDVDLKRVYVVGMSNGASFAQLLATHRSDQIAAVAAHSDTLPREAQASKPTRPFPVMLLVGLEELPAAIQTYREEAARYKQAGLEVELVEISGVGHAWDVRQNEAIWDFLSRHSLP